MNRKQEEVLKRHYAILALQELGYGLKQIALALGYKDHTTPWHHLVGHCKCEAP